MGRPSNPRLMARVLDAIRHLGEGKGSSARQVLELVRQAKNAPTRNLAMQVHRALKNAVTAGLLQLRSGRYKMLISLQAAVNNQPAEGNASKTGGNKSATKKREDPQNALDSSSPQPLEAGPRSRCSHCKKHKRRMSRRRRKRNPKRRARPTKQAKERNSRKLRRQGDEEVSNRRERTKKMAVPAPRSQSEVPDGKRSERKAKASKENDRDCDTQESARRNSSESPSDSESDEEAPTTTKANRSSAARRNDSPSPRRRTSSRRRSSKKRDRVTDNDPEDARMECDDDGHLVPDPVEEDACNACEHNTESRTSL